MTENEAFLKILNEETAKHFEKFEIENFSPENWLGVDQKKIAQILEEGYKTSQAVVTEKFAFLAINVKELGNVLRIDENEMIASADEDYVLIKLVYAYLPRQGVFISKHISTCTGLIQGLNGTIVCSNDVPFTPGEMTYQVIIDEQKINDVLKGEK